MNFNIFGGSDDESGNPITNSDLGPLHDDLERTANQIEQRRLSVEDRSELCEQVMSLLQCAYEATDDDEELKYHKPDLNPSTDKVATDIRNLIPYLSEERFLPSADTNDIKTMRRVLSGIQETVEEMEEFD